MGDFLSFFRGIVIIVCILIVHSRLLLLFPPGSIFEYCTRRETRYSRYELLWGNGAVKKVFLLRCWVSWLRRATASWHKIVWNASSLPLSSSFSLLPSTAHFPHGRRRRRKWKRGVLEKSYGMGGGGGYSFTTLKRFLFREGIFEKNYNCFFF